MNARTLEHLQHDDSVGRVDVVYVCSNQDIAAQNIARLRVTPGEPITLSTRLTLLGKHSASLTATTAGAAGKPVNHVALTPGTSFDRGWRTGKAEERAMLYLLLERAGAWDGWRRRAAIRALQASTRTAAQFENEIVRLRAELAGRFDEQITSEFLDLIRQSGDLTDFDVLLDDIGRRATLPPELKKRSNGVIGRLRMSLARAGVRTLEPDLIILDEFQRFRHLLSREEGGDSAELAHHLFGYGNAKVLLLSATPYKPFTLAEETQAGDDHHRDFLNVLEFLCNDPEWRADVTRTLAAYREAVVRDQPMDAERARLRELLLQVMCRTERPPAAQHGMLREQLLPVDDVPAEDMRGFVALRRIADALSAPITLEYWKSAPYFLNFTEGYQIGDKLRRAARAGDVDNSSRERVSAWSWLLVGPTYAIGRGPVRNRILLVTTPRICGSSWSMSTSSPSSYRDSSSSKNTGTQSAVAESTNTRISPSSARYPSPFGPWAPRTRSVAGSTGCGADRTVNGARPRPTSTGRQRAVRSGPGFQ